MGLSGDVAAVAVSDNSLLGCVVNAAVAANEALGGGALGGR